MTVNSKTIKLVTGVNVTTHGARVTYNMAAPVELAMTPLIDNYLLGHVATSAAKLFTRV